MDRQPGILTRSKTNELRLELIGGFDLSFEREGNELVGPVYHDRWTELPLILGETEHGYVSLLDCAELGFSGRKTSANGIFSGFTGVGRPQVHRFLANTALLGVALEDLAEPVFRKLTVEIENLYPFLAPPYTVVELTGGKRIATLGEEPTLPSLEFDGFIFSGVFKSTSFGIDRFTNRVEVTSGTHASIVITTPHLVSYEVIDRYTKQIMDLITFASGRPCGAIRESLSDEISGDAGAISVIEQKIHAARDDERYTRSHGSRFSSNDLPFDILLSRWFELRLKAGIAIDLLLGQVYYPGAYIQEKLLEVAAAAETLHTKLYSEKPRTKPEFRAFMDTLLCGFDDEATKKEIRDRFTNSQSFGTRMWNLLAQANPDAVQILVPEPAEWVGLMTAVRNTVAHGKDDELPSLLECQILIRQTSLLLTVVIMNHLGIAADRQVEVANDGILGTYRNRLQVRQITEPQ